MGRTIPSWRIIVEQEIAAMSRFKQFLRGEDRAVFDDLLNQCRLYAGEAGTLASSVKQVPLLLSMIFAHHKKLTELEKRIRRPCYVDTELCGFGPTRKSRNPERSGGSNPNRSGEKRSKIGNDKR